MLNQWFDSWEDTTLSQAHTANEFIDQALAEFLAWEQWVWDYASLTLEGNEVDEFIAEFDSLHAEGRFLLGELLAKDMSDAAVRCQVFKDPNAAAQIIRWGLIAT